MELWERAQREQHPPLRTPGIEGVSWRRLFFASRDAVSNGVSIDTYLGDVEQNDSRKIYPAKARRRKVTLVVISTEGRNLFRSLAFARDDGPRPVTSRLCVFAGDMVFPISSSFPNFKYFWLVLFAVVLVPGVVLC